MVEEDFFVDVGSRAGGGAPVPRKVKINTPEKMTKAEKKSWWEQFKEALYFYKTSEPPPGTVDYRKKPVWKAPKSALRTPADYMPAGTIRWRGKNWPAVWLNGTRYRNKLPSEYIPPEYDDEGNMVNGPALNRYHYRQRYGKEPPPTEPSAFEQLAQIAFPAAATYVAGQAVHEINQLPHDENGFIMWN